MTTQKLLNAKSGKEKDLLVDNQASLEKKVKALDTKVDVVLSSDFVESLRNDLSKSKAFEEFDSGGVVKNITVSKYQADSIIAKRAVMSESDMIVANDTDFFAFVGPKCILLKDFRMRRPRGNNGQKVALATITKMTLGCATETMKNKMLSALKGSPDHQIFNVKIPKFPIFGESCERLRAVAAVIIGSDVFVGGIKDLRAKKVFEEITNLKRSREGEEIGLS
jgi:hypothetical protein